MSTSKYYFLSTHRWGLTFLSVFTAETPPVFIMEFQHFLCDVIAEYFGVNATAVGAGERNVNETTVRENFSILLQLLDEMVDGGFPLTTELTQLKEMILPPSLARRLFANVMSSDSTTGFSSTISADLPTHALSKIPWRKADVKYVTNEIYFDLIESIDAILSPSGETIHANIFGDVNCNCRLSGMPDLTLSFTKPSLLDDVSLHRCVRINRYTREKVISFVPPDGQFKLMSYRIPGAASCAMPIYIRPQITYGPGQGKIYVQVGLKQNGDKTVTNVVVLIPLPACTRAASLTPNMGSVRIDSKTQLARWEIGKLPKDKTPTLEGSITLPMEFKADSESPTVRGEFVVKMLAASGLKVDGLAIRGVTYKPFKGIRSCTQSGKFTVRCNDS